MSRYDQSQPPVDALHPASFGPGVVRRESRCAEEGLLESEVQHRLEELDDAVFAALRGDAAALDRSGKLWRQMVREIEAPLLDESRSQYLRHAEKVWTECQANTLESLPRAFAAIEVMTLLTD